MLTPQRLHLVTVELKHAVWGALAQGTLCGVQLIMALVQEAERGSTEQPKRLGARSALTGSICGIVAVCALITTPARASAGIPNTTFTFVLCILAALSHSASAFVWVAGGEEANSTTEGGSVPILVLSILNVLVDVAVAKLSHRAAHAIDEAADMAASKHC